jgi:hypothetical protein
MRCLAGAPAVLKATDVLGRFARISKPFATQHSLPCSRLVTSTNATSAVSGVGVDSHAHFTTPRTIGALKGLEDHKSRHTE